ncbi:MAG: hypothetical protein ACE5Q6_04865 [Dehalococcoidia bacterium]
MGQPGDGQKPDLHIEATSCHPAAADGQWLVAWRIHNLADQEMDILSVWLPHDKFLSSQLTLDPVMRLLPEEDAILEVDVTCHEPPGSLVDNVYIILRLLWLEQTWRVFARHRVKIDAGGKPHPICEVVSMHPVGFSEGSRSDSAPAG